MGQPRQSVRRQFRFRARKTRKEAGILAAALILHKHSDAKFLVRWQRLPLGTDETTPVSFCRSAASGADVLTWELCYG